MQEAVYVLVSPQLGYYAQMTSLSIKVLKQTNPTIRVSLAVDQKTLDALEKTKDFRLIDLVDHIYPFEIEYTSNSIGSRIIKTQLALTVNKSFCFLDSDLIVRKTINFNFHPSKHIGVAVNHSREKFSEQIFDRDISIIEKMGWQNLSGPYLNSGVIFFDGSPTVAELAEKWHYYWKMTASKTGQYADQPALYKAISEMPNALQILPNSLNAQIKSRLWFPVETVDNYNKSSLDWDASIWHYYASLDNESTYTQFEYLLNKYSNIDEIPTVDLEKLIDRKSPWFYNTFLDKEIVMRTYQHVKIKGFYDLWIKGNKQKAIKFLFLKYLGKMGKRYN